MYVIATAGHIDHGKSALVTALTGIDPDRLPEEKARGMTIDLGFAWLELGEGQVVGVIDVPGHERFVRHMLAGVGGIDMALLIVAADEGIMPQTREHLAILDLLGVRHGVTALTKCDLVDDEWLSLVVQETRSLLENSSLQGAAIIPCSSRTGQGLSELRAAISAALAAAPPRGDRGRPRLPIDRVFSVPGHGTVVTGTLLDGVFHTGQEVEAAPSGRCYRIRALQSHHRTLDRVEPGRRIAINLAGAPVENLARGMVVCLPGTMPAGRYLDLRLRAVREPPHGYGTGKALLTHGQRIMFFTGAAEIQGTIRLLDVDALFCREECWAQVRLDAPPAVLRGDRCVIRVPSPAATVAGGEIVAVNGPRRTRKHPDIVRVLERLAEGSDEERVLDALAYGPARGSVLAAAADLPIDLVEAALANLRAAGQAVPLAPGRADVPALWATPTWLDDAAHRLRSALSDYHQRHPLQRGMRIEAARSQLRVERSPWSELLTYWRTSGVIGAEANFVGAPDHRVTFNTTQEREAGAFLARLIEQPYAPRENGADLEPELLTALLERGDPVRLTEDVLLRREPYDAMSAAALECIDREGMVTVAMLRDRFNTSRKFAVALLEHLDDRGLTRRLGDGRVRGPAARP